MALVPMPAVATRRVLSNDFRVLDPGRIEYRTLSGVKEVLHRGTRRFQGTIQIGQTTNQEDLRAIQAWLFELADGVNHTNIPVRDPGQRDGMSKPRTFGIIPASDDYAPGPPVVGTPEVSSTTVTRVRGNALVLNRELPGMNQGCYARIDGRTFLFARYTRTGPATGRDNVRVNLWPSGVAVAAGAVVERALTMPVRLLTDGGLPQAPVRGSVAGPWLLEWEEHVT